MSLLSIYTSWQTTGSLYLEHQILMHIHK